MPETPGIVLTYTGDRRQRRATETTRAAQGLAAIHAPILVSSESSKKVDAARLHPPGVEIV